MTNILEGIQFRELNPQLPSWNRNAYTEWKDTNGETTFVTGTQFRIKPSFVYHVKADGNATLTNASKTVAMSDVSKLIDQGFTVTVQKLEESTTTVAGLLAKKNIQFKLTDSTEWRSATYLRDSGYEKYIQFRIRPDAYWEVSVGNGIAQSIITFDEVDVLDKYVSRQLRTSENNIFITRRSYDVTRTIG